MSFRQDMQDHDFLTRTWKCFCFTDRWIRRLWHFHNICRDEVLWAWTDPKTRDRLNERIYNEAGGYLPGETYFTAGLFGWEKSAISSPWFPRQGLILLGGAGAGREIVALSKLGYRVLAFEPNTKLSEAAKQVVRSLAGCVAVTGSYGDFADAVEHGRGILAESIREKHFDAVILGWGSLSHVFGNSARVRLLRAARQVAPEAPLLLSFRPLPAEGKLDRFRIVLRKLFQKMGAPVKPEDGDVFDSAGFVHLFSAEGIRGLAEETRYNVVILNFYPYPHALLMPK